MQRKFKSWLGQAAELRERPDADRIGYTARGIVGEDLYCTVWPNRPSLARAIRMQERAGTRGSRKIHALVALRDTEGY